MTGNGVIDPADIQVIRDNYGNITGDDTFNPYYDANCDGKINVGDIARIGFEFLTR